MGMAEQQKTIGQHLGDARRASYEVERVMRRLFFLLSKHRVDHPAPCDLDLLLAAGVRSMDDLQLHLGKAFLLAGRG